jgi:DNA-binding transcriptional MerR regulator
MSRVPAERREGLMAPMWTVQDVADFLRVPVQTVYAWRSRGDGPPGRRVGKYVRYRPADVINWFDSGVT